MLQQAHLPNHSRIRRGEKGGNTLKPEPLDTPEPTMKTQVFQVSDSRFEPPDAVKTPFQYVKTFFTDKIEHTAQHTYLYSAQELRDPIKTSAEDIEDFLASRLFLGVFSLPSVEDDWHHMSHFQRDKSISCQRKYSSCNAGSFVLMIISSAMTFTTK